ncbi:hypothetical protein [Paenibacillus xylanexedens]|uniref:hypothetical protein n=1 Tax=Paenibacillus xylanexedens TaxID=528191 RepID=UPI000F54829C|nr:hypothetical protein [Paenibacillus xylanexedens]
MIKQHPFNHDLSLEVYNECQDMLKPKECYTNIYYTAVEFAEKFHGKEWKVAYGYIRISPEANLMARHCFIVNADGEAIDPTYFTHDNLYSGDVKEHTSFYIFNDITRYARWVEKNKFIPDLEKPLREKEKAMQEWARSNHMILVG